MKSILISTAAFALITSAGSVSAQGVGSGLYGSAFLGYGQGDTVAEVSSGSDFIEYTFEGEGGAIFGATVGMTVAPGIRAEAEVSYLSQNVDTLSVTTSGGGSGEQDVSDEDVSISNTYVMANVWYDIPGVAAGFTPYVGGGLGFATLNIEIAEDTTDVFDSGTGLAYQLGAGVQVPVGAGAIDLGYRYKAVTGAVFDDNFMGSGLDLEGESVVNTFQAAYVMTF